MKEKLLKKINSVSNTTKVKAFAIGSSVGAFLVPISAHADTGLDATVTSAITTGFSTATSAITTVVGLGVTATVGIIAVSGGAKAGLKWVKGAFAKAS